MDPVIYPVQKAHNALARGHFPFPLWWHNPTQRILSIHLKNYFPKFSGGILQQFRFSRLPSWYLAHLSRINFALRNLGRQESTLALHFRQSPERLATW